MQVVSPLTKKPACGCKTKTPGKLCQNPPVNGSERCRMHSGGQSIGPLNPRFKHGGSSRYIPPRLLDRYAEISNDPDLLSLRHDIALTDTRRDEILETLSSAQTWARVQDASTIFKHDPNDINLRILLSAIDAGVSEQAVWAEWSALGEQRRKYTDSERARLKDLQGFITVQDSTVVIARLMASVNEHVTDPHAKRAIAGDLRELLNHTPKLRKEAAEADPSDTSAVIELTPPA